MSKKKTEQAGIERQVDSNKINLASMFIAQDVFTMLSTPEVVTLMVVLSKSIAAKEELHFEQVLEEFSNVEKQIKGTLYKEGEVPHDKR